MNQLLGKNSQIGSKKMSYYETLHRSFYLSLLKLIPELLVLNGYYINTVFPLKNQAPATGHLHFIAEMDR